MKFMLSLLAVGYVAIVAAAPFLPVNPGGIGGLFRGPNSETIIRGPDGSVITSAAQGGEVHTRLEPIVVAEPVIIEEAAPVVQAITVPEPVVENVQSSDLIGPSGRISTKGVHSVVAGPASTTITGPAIVADTIVRGPPLVATSSLGFPQPSVSPLTAIASPAITALPISVTPTPWSPIVAGVSPISVTASPIATVTAAAHLPTVISAELGRTALVSFGTPLSVVAPSIATVTATPPVATVTAIAQVSRTATPGPVATASVSPFVSVAAASGGPGASVTATATQNLAAANVETVTASPFVTPIVTNGGHRFYGVNDRDLSAANVETVTASPFVTHIVNNGGSRFYGVNDRIDLTSQFSPDQISIDNNPQFNLNRALIPSGSIIPPEISVTPRIPIGRLRPTPGTLLTSPGLGAVATSNNIQRGEGDAALSVTPNTFQVTPQVTLTPEVLGLQNQQVLLHNQIQQAQTLAPNIHRNGAGLSVTPNPVGINPYINFSPEQVQVLHNYGHNIQGDVGTLSTTPNSLEVDPQVTFNPDQVAALQNQEILLNNQVQREQQATNSRILQPTQLPTDDAGNPVFFTPNIAGSVGNTPQQSLLAQELTKSGVDASQLQLTNIPLSAVSGLPSGTLQYGGINDGLGGDAWDRYGRDTEKEGKGKAKKRT